MKQLTKQKKKARLIKKRTEEYTCRRCKHSVKFDSNIKLHEHIRTRHAKKPKISVQVSESKSTSPASSSSVSSSLISSKLLSLAVSTPEIVRERSESLSSKSVVESPATFSEFSSDFSSVATPKKPISWAEIVSRPVAPKLSRLPIATLKLVRKSLKNANIACSSISPRTPAPKLYLIVNDLFHMFAEKSSPFGLQRHQMRFLSPRGPGKCSLASKCGPIQSRITSYFHAAASPASKSAKSEASGPTHARGSVSRQFSVSRWPSASPTSFPSRFASVRPSFSAFSRSSPVCRHCQGRFVTYWSTGWATPNASRVGNNEIPMGQRYWSFAPPRPTLGEY
ncbi:hypothetical protein G7Y79_00019g046630 [Physcia stellaris]|nr:hypothetical protein G7Y79_00019g046630 [Physcia stellaris]